MFSDKKKFNLDGTGEYQYNWQDARAALEIRMSYNFGGGTVMVWRAFSFLGKLSIICISIKMKSADYVNMFEASLLKNAENLTLIRCSGDFSPIFDFETL